MVIDWLLPALICAVHIFAGLLLADFATGLIHWFEDRYGDPSWPIIGHAIYMNQEHHKRPRFFLTGSLWKRNREVWMVCFATAALLLFLDSLTTLSGSFAFFGLFANEIHGASHRTAKENGALVRLLQRSRLIQSPLHHAAHHRRAKNTHYCTMTNWVNPILDRIGFFTAIERVILLLFGIRPRFDPTVPARYRRDTDEM